MSAQLQASLGLLALLLGGLKTWLHMGTVPVLSLPTCSGEMIEIGLGSRSLFAQAHCWGCYVFVAGLAITVLAMSRLWSQRRSVAVRMD